MEMQGNATEIDERNLLQLDALLSHGYGLSPQLVMRSKGLSIEAKALYGYLSSFAGAGDTAFPSTSRILEELDISKNRFYKIRKELISWGFISIETTATSAGLRTVYTLPQNPIAIKTEIDEIANRRNEIKSSLVANLHNEDMVSHKGDSESERLQQSAGNEPCRQSEAKAQNRGSNLKPCLQSEDEGCLQSGDKLYIDTSINPKVSIDRSATRPSDDEVPSNWKVIEGMTDTTLRDDGESDRDANGRDALDAVPDGTYDPLPTVADGYTLSNSEFEAFNRLCSLSIKTVRGAVRNEAAKQYAKRLGEGYSPATIEKAYIDYAEAYRQNNPYFNFVGRFVPPAFGEVELTPEELEEIRKREERKDRLHQNYLKRKANGKQKEYEERTKAKKKAEIEAKKAAIRAEDIAKGVFVPVSSLPQREPMKGVQTA